MTAKLKNDNDPLFELSKDISLLSLVKKINKKIKNSLTLLSMVHHTSSELAISLKRSWSAVARLENPKHWPSLRQLEKIANILGQQIIIFMEPIGGRNEL